MREAELAIVRMALQMHFSDKKLNEFRVFRKLRERSLHSGLEVSAKLAPYVISDQMLHAATVFRASILLQPLIKGLYDIMKSIVAQYKS